MDRPPQARLTGHITATERTGGTVMAIIVMTGSSSGFGEIAARLAREKGADVLAGARTVSTNFIPVDLACLDSVRAFAATVRQRLGDTPLDALVLNAGLILPNDAERTHDGFETTFAVNHLAHYLLVRLLMPSFAEEARIVITTSGTHDPTLRTGLEAPRHADADLLAHPDRDTERHLVPQRAGQHAYSASKLCNVLTVRALSVHPDIRARHITALAYDPGQVFGTGLVRSLPRPRRIAWSVFGTALGAPLRRLDRTMNTRAAAGLALASLVSGRTTPPPGRCYAALRSGRLSFPDPSTLARRDDVARALWNDSARMVGLTVDQSLGTPGLPSR
ncbi:SDR family NAD(P)-dependent oxidoreductase [Rhodococcus sp. HNM0563]|uniref:SDR family NAD(P)-dependent oxidoreductase n=1 Tax=Rhodococcus sp. HNM0563 TaxID=2716339 RepID=UPI00197D445B|nr:SDR family NAD(P)-dependent oxidoreductase [Rhodococcus sp. HNM0563]